MSRSSSGGPGTRWNTDCRFFNGFRPCHKKKPDCQGCDSYQKATSRIALINLDALGDVLRSTSLARKIKLELPESQLWWFTSAAAAPLLKHNPDIDHLVIVDGLTGMIAQSIHWDWVINLDKSLGAGSLMSIFRSPKKSGFGISSTGAIIPLTPEALELYQLGLDDVRKFQENQKSTVQLQIEMLGWSFNPEEAPYGWHWHPSELRSLEIRKTSWRSIMAQNRRCLLVGINVGCSAKYPYKKPDIQVLDKLIRHWAAFYAHTFQPVLLGGKEDIGIIRQLAQWHPSVIVSPWDQGLRDGAISIAACDVILTGDSLALHVAIATQRPWVGWFGPSCAPEIHSYGLGVKVVSDYSCAPCWKNYCDKPIKCHESISIQSLHGAILELCHAHDIPTQWEDHPSA